VEILQKLSQELSPQRLSDKLRDLRYKCISTYRVYLNWSVFDFTEVLFNCQATQENCLFFRNLLSSSPPPFQTTFREYRATIKGQREEGFFWYLSCPASHLINAFNSLLKISNDVKFYLLDNKTQYRAPLNIKALNKEELTWIVNEEYLLKNILPKEI
jgi:hypothetical protein